MFGLKRSGLVGRAFGVALVTFAFLLPAIINRGPIIYADVVGYFHTGEGALEFAASLGRQADAASQSASVDVRAADGISTARSIYYGAAMVVLFLSGGIWLVMLAQVVVTQVCLACAVPQFTQADPRTTVAISVLTALSGAAAFTATPVPDLFAGLAILATAILLAQTTELSSLTRGFWLIVVVVSCLFHKSILAIVVVLAAYAFVIRTVWRNQIGGLAWLTGAIAVALCGVVATNLAVERVSGRPPIDPPFLLARMVADGTIPMYLRENCASRRFELCGYDLTDITENEFLWGRAPARAVYTEMSLAAKTRVIGEAQTLIIGTLRTFPREQASASIANFGRQLFLVGIEEFGVFPGGHATDRSALQPEMSRYVRESGVARKTMPLATISVAMTAAYLIGFAMLLGIALVRQWRERISRQSWLAVHLIVAGVIANAAVCSIIGGVFDRYQGRVAWLIPFAALCLTATVIRAGIHHQRSGRAVNPAARSIA